MALRTMLRASTALLALHMGSAQMMGGMDPAQMEQLKKMMAGKGGMGGMPMGGMMGGKGGMMGGKGGMMGMMGGKGGPMGGMMGGKGGMMGGKGGPPPKPKAVSAGEAREALTGLMTLLNADGARQKVQGAMKAVMTQMQQDPNQDPKMKSQQRMMALVPVMNEISAGLTAKYGWKGGFMEMVASVGEHAKEDPTIARDLEPLRMLMMGEHPMAQKGKLPEFDKLAQEFGAKDKAGQEAAVAATEAAIAANTVDGKLKTPLAKYYLKTMKKVMELGQDFVETEAKRLMAKMKQKDMQKKRAMKTMKRVNILGSFITKSDMERMRKDYQGGKGGKGAPPVKDEA